MVVASQLMLLLFTLNDGRGMNHCILEGSRLQSWLVSSKFMITELLEDSSTLQVSRPSIKGATGYWSPATYDIKVESETQKWEAEEGTTAAATREIQRCQYGDHHHGAFFFLAAWRVVGTWTVKFGRAKDGNITGAASANIGAITNKEHLFLVACRIVGGWDMPEEGIKQVLQKVRRCQHHSDHVPFFSTMLGLVDLLVLGTSHARWIEWTGEGEILFYIG